MSQSAHTKEELDKAVELLKTLKAKAEVTLTLTLILTLTLNLN